MLFGASMFFTDYSMGAGELAQEQLAFGAEDLNVEREAVVGLPSIFGKARGARY